MLLSTPAGRMAFEGLEFAYLVNAVPLVADPELGGFVADVLARFPVLRCAVIDQALAAGRKDLAEKVVALMQDADSLYKAARYFLKYGIGREVIRGARRHGRYALALFQSGSFSPEEQKRLLEALNGEEDRRGGSL